MYCVFHSFKGGVGRTSALMNTAIHLSKRKKRVLIIDLDLAAPGVDIFDVVETYSGSKNGQESLQGSPSEMQSEGHKKDSAKLKRPSYNPIECYKALTGFHEKSKFYSPEEKDRKEKEIAKGAPKGFVELYLEFQKNYEQEGVERLPEITYPASLEADWNKERYIYLLPKQELGEGDILVMRAGQHESPDYNNRIAEIKFEIMDPGYKLEFDKRELPTVISNDSSHLDSSIEERREPPFVSELKRAIKDELMPDYVLVDSRPGMENISRFALTWFSECVVLVFNLNPWNLNGIINMYQDILKTPYQRKASNILLVASPIPSYAQSSRLYQGQYDLIKREMREARNSDPRGNDGGPVEIPYADILSLRDVLISDVAPNDPACTQYERLCKLIISGNPLDLERKIENAKSKGEYDEVMVAFRQLFREHSRDEALKFEYGFYLLEKLSRADEAESQLKEAWRLLIDKRKIEIESNRPISPYYINTAYQLSRAELIIVRQELNQIRENPNLKSESKAKALMKRLRETAERLSRFISITPTENFSWEIADEQRLLENEESNIAGPFHALAGSLYLLVYDYFTLIEEREFEQHIEHLERAKEQYEKAVQLEEREDQYYYHLGVVKGRLAALRRETFAEGYEDAIKDFEKAAELRSENQDALIQRSRYELSLAASTSDHPMPMFLKTSPYIEEAKISEGWPNGLQPKINLERLKTAKKLLEEAKNKWPHDYFSHFLLGLTEMLMAAEYRNKNIEDLAINALENAITAFNDTFIYEPLYPPALFYSSLIQFLLIRQTHPGTTMRKIRSRQAFYRLEHFIDQELERMFPEEFNSGKNKRKPFYFNHKDIQIIEENSLAFMRAIEDRLSLPPLINLMEDKTIEVNPEYIELIRAYIGDLA